jgi:CheY-like chemotaxis protein
MSECVLIVDDNPLNLKLARIVLETAGYAVETAIDAEGALRVLGSKHPRVILMDIQLPGMDGLALTRQLKSHGATSGIAIVAVTAYAMAGDEEKALAAGCDGYLRKPFDTAMLPELVAAYMRRGE